MALLDPKLDVVFMLLFSKPENQRLLVSLLTAVLAPSRPIIAVRVLDKELTMDTASDKGVRLDVLVELADGRLIDVEMQCDARGADPKRWIYHWARLFSGRLRRGEPYSSLKPVIAIVFLDVKTDASRFHSVHHVREIHTGKRLSDVFELHLVELPRLAQHVTEQENALLVRWARFLRFGGSRALDSLASEDPIMTDAKEALERLSRDPYAQRLAERRRETEDELKMDHILSVEHGEKKRARAAVEAVLRARAFVPTGAHLAQIEACDDLARLDTWLARAATATSLEAVFHD